MKKIGTPDDIWRHKEHTGFKIRVDRAVMVQLADLDPSDLDSWVGVPESWVLEGYERVPVVHAEMPGQLKLEVA